MFDRDAQPEAAVLEPLFEIHTGTEIREIAEKSAPAKSLFGDFWAEGEMAILFGDHGTGKSILSAQIGDAIARGRGTEPFGVTTQPRTVLYLDLEQTSAQFAGRYAGEYRSYKFSVNFKHVAVDPFAEVPEQHRNFVEYLSSSVEELIRRTRPKAVIVDSLAYLKRTNDITRDVLPFIRVLSRLKRELGLSVLLVAPSQRRLGSGTMEIGDMQAGRGLCAFADSIFAIGVSGGDTSRRYLKQLKCRRREVLHDRSHTVEARIKRGPTGNLSLVFDKFTDESVHLRDSSPRRDWDLIERAKKLSEDGIPYSLIGKMLGVSKTSAHRLVQMWAPHAPDCPYANNGNSSVPPKPEELPDFEPDEDNDLDDEDVGIEVPELDQDDDDEYEDEPEAEPERILQGPPDLGALAGFPATTPSRNNGRDIWVEKWSERGKPVIWYEFGLDGEPRRCVRDAWGISKDWIK